MLKNNIIKNCRVCNTRISKQDVVIDMGKMAVTGVFLKKKIKTSFKPKITLVLCKKCKLLQLKEIVNPNFLFKNYWYESGINSTMKNHLFNLSKYSISLFKNKNIRSLDIGCNDGTLMESLSKYIKKKNIYGIDPAKGIFKKKNYNFHNSFFNKKTIVKNFSNKKFNLITSVAMFYDVNNPIQFVKEISDILDEKGIWICELNYLGDLVKNLSFDTICHEHVSYYSLSTFKNILDKTDLKIRDISFNTINGGSIRITIDKNNKKINPNIKKFLNYEKRYLKLDKVITYKKFNKNLLSLRKKINNFMINLKNKNKKIAILGASTRGNTILQYLGLNEKDFIGASDRNPKKNGMYMNGTLIPIFSEKKVREEKPDFFFILPYFYIDEILDREKFFLKNGGKILSPLPKPTIFYWNKKIKELRI